MGYTNVYDYTGGIDDWMEAGLPIEVGPGNGAGPQED
jgi:rhodanese-related sulfurtransferase